jgi:CBS domain-containing protein
MLKLRDIMTTDVITLAPDLSLRAAMDLFVDRHISGAPVVAGRNVVGVVSATDFLRLSATLPGPSPLREEPEEEAALEPLFDESDAVESGSAPPASYFTAMWDEGEIDVSDQLMAADTSEWHPLEAHTVEEAMNPTVCSLPPDTDVPGAAAYMQRMGVHRVLVMEGDTLLGIVTTSDVARAVSEHRLSQKQYVFGKPRVREGGAWW